MAEPSSLPFHADAALTSREDDRLGRDVFADRVADTIARRPGSDSMTVGLYGAWGSGKTTVLNFVREALDKHEAIVTLAFNPWRFGDEEALLRSFFAALATAVEVRLTTRGQAVVDRLLKYGVATITSVAASVAGAQLEALTDKARQYAQGDLDEMRRRVGKALVEAEVRVVVFLDDLDRLDKTEFQAIFRLLKLTADFANTTYVLALDPEVVADAIGERFGSNTVETGRAYLEKVVALPLQLPRPSEDALFKLCWEGIRTALQTADIEFDRGLQRRLEKALGSGLFPAVQTPREARRLGNALLFALPLLRGEVNVVDQVLLEGARILFPLLYRHIALHPSLYLRDSREAGLFLEPTEAQQQERQQALAHPISKLPSHKRATALALVRLLFPQTMGDTPESERWERDQRIASERYFPRYFRYQTAAGEVSDNELTRFVQNAISGAIEGPMHEAFGPLVKQMPVRPLLSGLRHRVEALDHPDPSLILQLAFAIAHHSQLYPRDNSDILSGSPASTWEAAAIAVSFLIERLPLANRLKTARSLLENIPSLPFAASCMSWLTPGENETPDDFPLSREDRAVLIRLLAGRIRAEAQSRTAPLHEDDPRRDAHTLYRIWAEGASRDEPVAYLRDWLARRPESSVPLLLNHTIRLDTESNVWNYLDFGAREYDALSEYVDPADVFKAVEHVFGPEVGTEAVEPARLGSGEPPGHRVPAQFAFIHRRRRDGEPPLP